MNKQFIAMCIAQAGSLLSAIIRTRQPSNGPTIIWPDPTPKISGLTAGIVARPLPEPEPLLSQPDMTLSFPEPAVAPAAEIPKAAAIATGCIPCSLGHVGTCSGVLNEAMRFARKDGIESDEVINRVGMCLDELNAMERVDMRPEMTAQLTGWEKELAEKTLAGSRGLRHALEGLANGGSPDDLETIAAQTQAMRQEIGRTWFKSKLAHMSPEDKEEVQKRVAQKIQEMTEKVETEDVSG